MILKKFSLILFLILSLFPFTKINAQSSEVGFVPGNIWYSKDPFEEGDKIKIYTFIYNSDSKELSGTVVFFDKTTLLGKKNFTLAGKTANEISIDWTVSAGDHKIFAKIENAKFLISKDKYEEIYIADNKTEESSRTVNKKITSKENNSTSTENNIVDTILNTKNNIQDSIPDNISKPVTSTINKLDNLRENIRNVSDNKKEEIQKEIDTLNKINTTKNSSKGTNNNPLLKPFKYVELFLLAVSSMILNNKILFYGIIILIVFFSLRFIWKRFF
ncbi:MAG: hypothetical protein NDI62_01785 [Burkholderiales bacterium]|nr:hypothetical protein [Burkholderiales bacterium]